MRITHVIRGDDHINNTPRQQNMLVAMGATIPEYAHLAMILGPDGAKLSKRHGAVSVLEYREDGYLPEALLNYLGRLGWSHGDQEIFSIDEMIRLFDLADVNKSASALNLEKLAWTNQQHMLKRSGAELATLLGWHLARLGVDATGLDLAAIADVQKERARTMKEMAEKSVFFCVEPSSYEEKAAAKNLGAGAVPILEAVRDALAALGDFSAPAVHAALEALATRLGVGLGKIAQPVRVALSGGAVSPPIDATVAILGRTTTARRLERALEFARANGGG
jgi:glutamyl-tRNA synthetase